MNRNPNATNCSQFYDATLIRHAPRTQLNDAAKFKEIWKADYANFQHKAAAPRRAPSCRRARAHARTGASQDDCVHYSFGFTDDGRAHCREAYKDAAACLQHLANVDAPLNAVLDGPAELERLEVRRRHPSAPCPMRPIASARARSDRACSLKSPPPVRTQAHGPAAEIEKLKEALTPFGCKFFVAEWGFRPSKPAMEFDSARAYRPLALISSCAERRRD